MGTDTTDPAEQLGVALGGRVASLRRLSGGASRITSAFDLETTRGAVRPLILQQVRATHLLQPPDVRMEADLLREAHRAGVPVPAVVAVGTADGLRPGWLVVERLDGETIPRRILRGEGVAAALPTLTDQTARALAAVHAMDLASIRGLPQTDPLGHPLEFLDALGEARPVLELGARWLARDEPSTDEWVVVHGDFRMGNFLVDGSGLRAVLDWELAHRGDPAEDIGWLCARAWRFGGPGRVGGFGDLDRFLASYAGASGRTVDLDRVRWWEAYATVKWAVICLLQSSTHLSGAIRSVELAALGRRVCESEWDLLALMGVVMPSVGSASGPAARGGAVPRPNPPYGRPSTAELVEAVRDYLADVMDAAHGSDRFQARVAHNVLAIVRRELDLGPAGQAAHDGRLGTLELPDDAAAAAAIRAGRYDGDLAGLGTVLAEGTRDQLMVANPSYLDRSW